MKHLHGGTSWTDQFTLGTEAKLFGFGLDPLGGEIFLFGKLLCRFGAISANVRTIRENKKDIFCTALNAIFLDAKISADGCKLDRHVCE